MRQVGAGQWAAGGLQGDKGSGLSCWASLGQATFPPALLLPFWPSALSDTAEQQTPWACWADMPGTALKQKRLRY